MPRDASPEAFPKIRIAQRKSLPLVGFYVECATDSNKIDSMSNQRAKATLAAVSWITVLMCASCTVYNSSDRTFFNSNGWDGNPPTPAPTTTPSSTPLLTTVESIEPKSVECHVVDLAHLSLSADLKIDSQSDTVTVTVEHRLDSYSSVVQIIRRPLPNDIQRYQATYCILNFPYLPSHEQALLDKSQGLIDSFIAIAKPDWTSGAF